MKKSHRGFIPLVAIILLGLVAVGGGVVATISFKGHEEVPITPEQIDSLAPVSARVESSDQIATSTPTQSNKSIVEAIKTEIDAEVFLDTNTQEICDKVTLEAIDSTKQSLLGDMSILCKKILNGEYQGEDLENVLTKLQDRWKIYLTVQKAQESTERRAEDIKNSAL